MSSSFSRPRRVHVLGLLGTILLLCGLFLPLPPTTSPTSFIPRVGLSSFVSLLLSQITSSGASWFSGIAIGFFLLLIVLPLLTGILTYLTGFLGQEQRALCVIHLIVIAVGLVEFLLVSYVATIFGIGFWVILSGFLVSLGASIAQNLKTDLSLLPSFSIPRRAHMLNLLGAACLLSGWFLPWITTNFAGEPPQSGSIFLWSVFVSSVGYDWSLLIGIIFFLLLPMLPCLTGILIALAELFGKGKRMFSTVHLIVTVIGFYNFLVYSLFSYCIFYCGATGDLALRGSRIFNSGFWLILAGLIVFLGVSMAQFKSREVLNV